MTAFEYVEAMARVRALPSGERQPAWRAAKSARQRYLNQRRRERDPQWWHARLTSAAQYRRERAAQDADYRQRRNAQSHTGRGR